jgi:hypothetical protein
VNTLKILGQSVPAANTLTTLYTVPAATSASISSLIVCNQNSYDVYTNFSVSLAVGGAADSPEQYIYYKLLLNGYNTFIATIGISLATTDQVRIISTAASVSFSLTGVEVV